MGRRSALLFAATLATSALFAPLLAAQDPPKVNIIRLEPATMAGIEKGKAVVVKGQATPEGHRFLVDGITSLQPVTILLRPVRKGEEVGLRLTKYAWNQPLREGSTTGDILNYKIRTEGEFQITVVSDQVGTDYRLLVWVGDEVKPTMRPVVMKASEFEENGSSWGSLVLWLIAGLLLAVVGLLAVIVLRRKSP